MKAKERKLLLQNAKLHKMRHGTRNFLDATPHRGGIPRPALQRMCKAGAVCKKLVPMRSCLAHLPDPQRGSDLTLLKKREERSETRQQRQRKGKRRKRRKLNENGSSHLPRRGQAEKEQAEERRRQSQAMQSHKPCHLCPEHPAAEAGGH